MTVISLVPLCVKEGGEPPAPLSRRKPSLVTAQQSGLTELRLLTFLQFFGLIEILELLMS